MNAIKLIAFDLFGVLITEGHMVSNVLMPLLPDMISKETVKKHYERYTRGHISEDAFWHNINQKSDPALRQTFLDNFILDDDYHSTIKTLSPKFQLALLSNLASDWYDDLNVKFQFERNFSPIIISGQAGYGKPDQQIYQTLIKRSGYKAQEIAFIDDRLENHETAHLLGMTSIYFQKEKETYNFTPDYIIHCLKDLSKLLPLR